ncbi:hypothetical protein AJ80_05661 [Polytolypa hystricis UAMH7299]|uniref:Uncharacterized protein n=1 Tax=Polytolypa hystricis (strain UAMH7299) TaxID=1447883 RepID=A0A2B7Y1Y6_POLH7|nr:hypothetical protein AJ80_05661 [Polytolypa hystricis UAMH7299]
MFSWGGGLAVPSVAVDADKERTPPEPPTPLDFPAYIPRDETAPPSERSCDALYRLLSRVKKPQDITEAYLKRLNLAVEPDVPVSDILPGGVLPTLAPYHWPEPSSDPAPSGDGSMPIPILMNNGSPFPPKEKYDQMREELCFDNDDAFRSVARVAPRPGRERVRIAQSRKFWAGLDQIAQYWDTSLDKYIERPADNPPMQDKMHVNDKEEGGTPPNSEKTEGKRDIDGQMKAQGSTKGPSSGENTKGSGSKTMYSGLRIGTGREMPEQAREDTLRGLVEMVAWSFGCQASIPSMPPRLAVKGLLFPVRQTFTVSRCPQDRQTARKGILEGPMVLVQCREETAFHEEKDGQENKTAEICDLLRETAAMLLFAQERAREGATEVRLGDGKWWTTTPRWGGAANAGPSGDQEEKGENNSKDEPSADEQAPNKRSKLGSSSLPFRRPGSHSKKLSVGEKWRLLQPGPSLWDKKMRYMQIGKDKDSPFDDIFMLSSINHHFAIIHLRVHRNYLEWLKSGKSDFPDETTMMTTSGSDNPPWYAIKLRRTKWFDLLRPDDRVEGFDALWALFTWLMR